MSTGRARWKEQAAARPLGAEECAVPDILRSVRNDVERAQRILAIIEAEDTACYVIDQRLACRMITEGTARESAAERPIKLPHDRIYVEYERPLETAVDIGPESGVPIYMHGFTLVRDGEEADAMTILTAGNLLLPSSHILNLRNGRVRLPDDAHPEISEESKAIEIERARSLYARVARLLRRTNREGQQT